MLTDSTNFVALHLRWFLGSVAVLGSAGGWYYSVARSSERWPGGSSVPGLVLGVVAGLIIVFECALGLRKTRLFRTSRILGSAQFWMKAHIWLGLIVGPLAWLHSGFNFGGTLTSIVMWILFAVILSGIFGLWMQNVVPRWMLDHVRGETVFSQIDLVKRQYAQEAARIVYRCCDKLPEQEALEDVGESQAELAVNRVIGARRRVGRILLKSNSEATEPVSPGTANAIWNAYEHVVQPYLEGNTRSSNPLQNRRRSRDYFSGLHASVSAELQETVTALERLCDQSRDLNFQRRLHYLLHGWLAVHLPLSISLLMLLVIHVLYALRFG